MHGHDKVQDKYTYYGTFYIIIALSSKKCKVSVSKQTKQKQEKFPN